MQAPPDNEDKALVERCLAGDSRAWQTLVHRYERLVYAIAQRAGLGADETADTFQTVFTRLLQHLRRIDDPSRLQAWIVTTTKREVMARREQARRVVFIDDGRADAARRGPVDETPGPEATVERWQQVLQVWRAWQRLDEPCRRLLETLFGADAPRYDEVSQRLGMPVGSIGPLRARCLAKLRRAIE